LKAIHAPDSENIVFETIGDLKHALGFEVNEGLA
jgi:hypothetical protein